MSDDGEDDGRTRIFAFFDRYRRDYQLTFQRSNPSAMRVLSDLEDFCYANKSIAAAGDEFQRGVREGRRQVWLKLMRAIHLTPEEQFNLASKRDTV